MRARWISALMFAMAAVAVPNAGSSQEIGKSTYLASCASCHGVEGRGDGPVAKTLKQRPADLTKLSDANGGVFPLSRVYRVIDGRFEVETHGTREMPVWGELFKPVFPLSEIGNGLDEVVVRARILAVIEYVSTLQKTK